MGAVCGCNKKVEEPKPVQDPKPAEKYKDQQASETGSEEADASSNDEYFKKDEMEYIMKKYPEYKIWEQQRINHKKEKIKQKKIKFQEGEVLGVGGFGKVIKGLSSNGKQMAVKQVEIGAAHTQAQNERIKALEVEIELLSQFRHKNIVGYIGSLKKDTKFNIFLEYVSGGSLASVIEKYGTLNEKLIKVYTKQILDGLEYLHVRDTVHRDIKGANVLVTKSGFCKLTDFGTAKRIESIVDNAQGDKYLPSIKGTVNWMAPEVIKQSDLGRFCDIWSLGCTVIEMATGKAPWSNLAKNSGTAASTLYQIAQSKTHPPLPEEVSNDLKDFLKQCFQINPRKRANVVQLANHPFLKGVTNQTPELQDEGSASPSKKKEKSNTVAGGKTPVQKDNRQGDNRAKTLFSPTTTKNNLEEDEVEENGDAADSGGFSSAVNKQYKEKKQKSTLNKSESSNSVHHRYTNAEDNSEFQSHTEQFSPNTGNAEPGKSNFQKDKVKIKDNKESREPSPEGEKIKFSNLMADRGKSEEKVDLKNDLKKQSGTSLKSDGQEFNKKNFSRKPTNQLQEDQPKNIKLECVKGEDNKVEPQASVTPQKQQVDNKADAGNGGIFNFVGTDNFDNSIEEKEQANFEFIDDDEDEEELLNANANGSTATNGEVVGKNGFKKQRSNKFRLSVNPVENGDRARSSAKRRAQTTVFKENPEQINDLKYPSETDADSRTPPKQITKKLTFAKKITMTDQDTAKISAHHGDDTEQPEVDAFTPHIKASTNGENSFKVNFHTFQSGVPGTGNTSPKNSPDSSSVKEYNDLKFGSMGAGNSAFPTPDISPQHKRDIFKNNDPKSDIGSNHSSLDNDSQKGTSSGKKGILKKNSMTAGIDNKTSTFKKQAQENIKNNNGTTAATGGGGNSGNSTGGGGNPGATSLSDMGSLVKRNFVDFEKGESESQISTLQQFPGQQSKPTINTGEEFLAK